MFWRANKQSLTHIMQRYMRFCEESQKWQRISESIAVKAIFAKKKHLHIFIDLVLALISDQLHYITANMQELIGIVQKVFEELWGVGQTRLEPIKEVMAYQALLSCASYDWAKFKTVSTTLIEDDSLGERVFYTFVNDIGKKAFDEARPIPVCFCDTHQRQSLKLRQKQWKNKSDDEIWLSYLTTDYNHKEAIAYELRIARAQSHKGSGGGMSESDSDMSSDSSEEEVTPKKGKTKKSMAKKAKNKALTAWKSKTPSKLKKKYRKMYKKGESLCGVFHSTEVTDVCETKAGKCKFGAFGRSHKCLCGKKHAMHVCNEIWK